ncbi:MAG: PKD domain-containing protein, partial [Bacteroidota bacterium]
MNNTLLMKFLRALLLFFFLSCVREGLAQITCDFTFQNSAAVKCTPYFLLATANNVSSSAVIERCWYLTGPQPFTVCNNQLNSTFSTVITTEGIYSLRLWTRNANGDTCFIEKTIEIAPKPVTNFTFAPLEGCAPLCVQAVCNSQAGVGRVIDSVVVDWGCGPITFLNACTPTPITRCFTCPPGIYSPTVVIKNDAGCYDDTTYLSLVRVLTPPVASFTGDTTYANCASGPLTVNFVADNAGPNMTYVWYIDAALVQSGPSRFLNNRVFAINNANCYDIKLVVTHPSGCGDSLVRNDYICVRSVPQVSFTQNATTGCVSAQSPFTLGLTSNTGSLSWSLSNTGGGTYPTQNGTVATYSLTLPGTYTVTATGTFGIGCSATTTQQVLVLSPKPVAAFTANDRFGCSPPDTVSYTATPCANCRYQWTLDGATPRLTSQQNPTVIYTGYGPWTSSLRVTDTITGCSDTLTRPGYINLRRISPVIGRNRVEGCSPVCVDFQDRTNYSTFPDSVSSICWSFSGNVPGACQSSLNRCFTDPGCYNVKLVVTSTTGCVDSTTINRAICVGTPPVCTFSANPTTMCFEEEPIVISTTCDSFDYFHVNWGDGDSGDVYTPVFEHFYQDTGNLTTCITPYRDSCAGVKYCFPVRVNPPIAGWTDSSTCFTGDTVFFVNKTAGATSYLWNFCDGTTSTLTNPFKVFPRCDTCTVTLAAYNSFTGCTHEKTARVNTACDGASLSPRTRSGCGPLTVNFFNTSASSTPNFTRWYFNCNNCTNFSGCPNSQGGNTTTFTFNTVGNHCVAMRNRTSSGCIDTVYSFIKVCKPIANFTSNNSCFPDPICFTYRGYDSLCAIIRRRWSFGDGTVDSVTLNPCHLYTTPGSYQVTLFIQNDAGCTSTITKTVIVSDTVRLNYLLDDTLCPGTTHCVTNSSIGANLTYQWTIPDAFPGDTFTDPAPCYTINTEGDYWIYVNISSNNVCTTTDSTLIHAHPPTASGYISDNFIECPNPPQIIQFISTSTYYDSLAWNFGDLVFSNLDTAAHIYSYPGVYPICITTTTYDGCSSTACIDTIVVEGPYGSLTVLESPGICACEDTVHFQVSTVNSNALTLLYGCAQGFVQDNSITPIGTQANPTVINFQYAYCLIDSCQPQMIFGDTTGCLVYVEAPFIYIDSPTVNFTFDSYASCLTGIVCFSDSTTYNLQPYQSYTIQRRWDFGDNSAPDTSANPCHTYPGAGTYNPRLYIWSNLGCFDSMVSQVVIIPEIPRAEFYADDSTVCAYTSVCFHSISTTDSLTAVEFRTWDFGDGTLDTSNRRNVCHTYTAGGLYRVTLCIRDSLGCPNCDSSFVIQIIDNPVADAGGDQTICYDVSTLLNGTGAAFCLWSPSGLVSDPAICNPT